VKIGKNSENKFSSSNSENSFLVKIVKIGFLAVTNMVKTVKQTLKKASKGDSVEAKLSKFLASY